LFLSLNMGFIPFLAFDKTTTIVVSIITVIGIYWFWLKPRLSSSNNSNDILKTIRPLKPGNELVGKPSVASHEGSFVDRMLHSGKTMVVFYGSQTGTAEDFAQRMAKQAKRYGISAAVCDPEECDMVCYFNSFF
ncbi:unnamed protein product, partial [Adineta steineri]